MGVLAFSFGSNQSHFVITSNEIMLDTFILTVMITSNDITGTLDVRMFRKDLIICF